MSATATRTSVSRSGDAMIETPTGLKPVLDVIPEHCYQRSTTRGMLLFGRDVVIFGLAVWGLLSTNNEALHAIATALLTREVLDGEEIAVLVEGRELPELKPSDDGPRGKTPGGPDSSDEPERTAEEQSPHVPALDEGQPAEG